MQDLDEDLADTVQQCPDCGTPVVRLGAHRCGRQAASTRPHQQDRLAAAAQETRDDGEAVLLVPDQQNGGAYAYHERAADGTPVCGGQGPIDVEKYRQTTRKKAKRRGRSHCRSCAKLLEKHEKESSH